MSSGGEPPFCAWWTAASWPSASLFSASRCAARSFFCASRSATRTQHSKLRCVEMNLCSFIYVLLHRPSFECKLRNSCEPLKNLKLFLEFIRIRIGIAFFVCFFSSRFACFAFFFAAACSARSSCWRFLRAKSTFRGTVVLPKERDSSTERAIFKSLSIKIVHRTKVRCSPNELNPTLAFAV